MKKIVIRSPVRGYIIIELGRIWAPHRVSLLLLVRVRYALNLYHLRVYRIPYTNIAFGFLIEKYFVKPIHTVHVGAGTYRIVRYLRVDFYG